VDRTLSNDKWEDLGGWLLIFPGSLLDILWGPHLADSLTQRETASPLSLSASGLPLAPRRRPPPRRPDCNEWTAALFMQVRVDMIASTLAHRMRP